MEDGGAGPVRINLAIISTTRTIMVDKEEKVREVIAAITSAVG